MKKDKFDNIYYDPIDFDNIYSVWNTVKKTCKNKNAILRFQVNKSANIQNICECLLHKTYKPLKFKLFVIFEPKVKLVMSQSVWDKIVNHFVVKFYLIPCLERKLIDSNVATRKNKGSAYASKLLINYINEIRIKEKNKEIFCLNIDISKYFYSIDHNILLKKLKRDMYDQNVVNLIKTIIDETNKPYINETINYLNNKYKINIPLYKKDVGLSIGAMTSQFLAIYYLNDLDHFIKEKLKCKYYIRYMDDFIILDTDREKLKSIWRILAKKIENLNLKVNPKSNIVSLNLGLFFVGYKYIIEGEKFNIKYKSKTVRKINKRLNVLKKYDLLKYYRSLGSYNGYFSKIKKTNGDFKMKTIEKYEYYKEKYKDYIVFIKEGSFYKTFKDDAVIIWDMFDYKWNKDSIGFGIMNNKVFDYLKSKDIGYVIFSDKEQIIDGNSEVYRLYSELAAINYNKWIKNNNAHQMLDEVLNKDMNNYELIINFFNSLGSKEDDSLNYV